MKKVTVGLKHGYLFTCHKSVTLLRCSIYRIVKLICDGRPTFTSQNFIHRGGLGHTPYSVSQPAADSNHHDTKLPELTFRSVVKY